MKVRAPLAAALAAVLVAATVSGCSSSNVGVAAKIDGTRITESQLSNYITPAAQGVELQQGAPKTPPKSFALFILVLDRLYSDLLRSTKGGMPAPGVISSEISKFVGDQTPQHAVAGLRVHGYTPALDNAVLRFRALSTLLGERARKGVDVGSALKKLSFPVTINPRYGTWDAKNFTIKTSTRAGLPDFLQLQPSTRPLAAPTGDSD